MVTDTSRFNWRRALSGEHEVTIPVLLFALLGAPLAWSLHFAVVYFLVALYCTTGRTDVTVEIALATVVAAGMSVASGVVAYRKWRELQGDEGWAEAVTTRVSLSTFLLVMGVLGAALFTLLIVLEGLPPLFVPACSEIQEWQ